MTTPMDERGASESSNRNFVILTVLSIYLIATFLWRVVTPAHEYPMRDEQVMTIGLDLLCLVGLVGLKTRVSRGAILFWFALAAGLGLFAIRLSGDASWWTGHLLYTLLPR